MLGVRRELGRLRERVAAINELARVQEEINNCITEERVLRQRLRVGGSRITSEAEGQLKAAINAHGLRLAELSSRRTEVRRVSGPSSEFARVGERLARRQQQWATVEERAGRADDADADRAEQQHGVLAHQLQELEMCLHHLQAESAVRADMGIEQASREGVDRAAYRMGGAVDDGGWPTESAERTAAAGVHYAAEPDAARHGASLT
jgi:chromosome segregation ATPase